MNRASSASTTLAGRVAVVTGAAQGLGFAIAEQLARDGACVWLADVQSEQADSAAANIRAQGLSVRSAHLDISDTEKVTAFFRAGAFNRLDILVNNAGTGQKICPIVELSDEEWG